MKKAVILLICCLAVTSCYTKQQSDKFDVRTDIRFGNRFFSILINAKGQSIVLKGKSSNYLKPFFIIHADTSKVFKLDSIKAFYRLIDSLEKKPRISDETVFDSPRVEIYYNNQKILNQSMFDRIFLRLFGPHMEQIPDKYNPFLSDEHPFA